MGPLRALWSVLDGILKGSWGVLVSIFCGFIPLALWTVRAISSLRPRDLERTQQPALWSPAPRGPRACSRKAGPISEGPLREPLIWDHEGAIRGRHAHGHSRAGLRLVVSLRCKDLELGEQLQKWRNKAC